MAAGRDAEYRGEGKKQWEEGGEEGGGEPTKIEQIIRRE